MTKILPLLIAATALPFLAGTAPAAPDNPLAAERWHTRPLVLIAPTADDPAAKTLALDLAQPDIRAALAERQVVVFTILAGHGTREGVPLPPPATAALLAALSLPPDGPATTLLIGKDGGIKLRRTTLPLRDILATIDRMPMRRQEISRP